MYKKQPYLHTYVRPKALISAEAKKSPILKMTFYNNLLLAYFHENDWICHLATFIIILVQKGGQVIKPIVFVKICYKLLYYVIQVVYNIFNR